MLEEYIACIMHAVVHADEIWMESNGKMGVIEVCCRSWA